MASPAGLTRTCCCTGTTGAGIPGGAKGVYISLWLLLVIYIYVYPWSLFYAWVDDYPLCDKVDLCVCMKLTCVYVCEFYAFVLMTC